MSEEEPKACYWDRIWSGGNPGEVTRHPLHPLVEGILEKYSLFGKDVLEVGCGTGNLQHLSANYTGTDIAPDCGRYIYPPGKFAACPADKLPFPDNSFDFVFSVYVLEHVPEVGAAVAEIRRGTRPGGVVMLKPAWFCRPWTGRPWLHKSPTDCSFHERLLRLSVKVRNSVPYRAADLLGWRLRGLVANPRHFRCRKITPNHHMPEVIDADAESWLDPLDFIRWFQARGDECLSHPTLVRQLTCTQEAVVLRIRTPAK